MTTPSDTASDPAPATAPDPAPATTPEPTPATLDVLAAVRAGRTRTLPALLEPLDRARRRELLAALKELRGELRADGWARWEERDRITPALLVAGAACQSGAAAPARPFRRPVNRPRPPPPPHHDLERLGHRDPKRGGL
ncbi:hypothetical protein ACFXA3_04370, partial [Streptomyces sp. NPDC059456]